MLMEYCSRFTHRKHTDLGPQGESNEEEEDHGMPVSGQIPYLHLQQFHSSQDAQ